MAWVTWRQHRLTLAGVVAVFGAAAVYLLITGLPMHDAYAAVTACHPASSSYLPAGRPQLPGEPTSHRVLVTAGLLQAIPALIGAFVGAPVLAREFETGTFRYAWTQGFGRTRWTDRQAGAARGRGHHRGRRVRRALLLVLPADHRRGRRRQRPAEPHDLRPTRRCAPRLDAGRVRDRRPGRHPDPSGHSRDVRHPRRVGRARRSDRRVPAPALRGAAASPTTPTLLPARW